MLMSCIKQRHVSVLNAINPRINTVHVFILTKKWLENKVIVRNGITCLYSIVHSIFTEKEESFKPV